MVFLLVEPPSLRTSLIGPAIFVNAYAPLSSVESLTSRIIGFSMPITKRFVPSFGTFAFKASTNTLNDFGINLSAEPLPGKSTFRNRLANVKSSNKKPTACLSSSPRNESTFDCTLASTGAIDFPSSSSSCFGKHPPSHCDFSFSLIFSSSSSCFFFLFSSSSLTFSNMRCLRSCSFCSALRSRSCSNFLDLAILRIAVDNPIRSLLLSRSMRTASLGARRSASHSYFFSSSAISFASFARFPVSTTFETTFAANFAHAISHARSSASR